MTPRRNVRVADLVTALLPAHQQLLHGQLRSDREDVAIGRVGVDLGLGEPARVFERYGRITADPSEQIGPTGLLHVHEEPPLLDLGHDRDERGARSAEEVAERGGRRDAEWRYGFTPNNVMAAQAATHASGDDY